MHGYGLARVFVSLFFCVYLCVSVWVGVHSQVTAAYKLELVLDCFVCVHLCLCARVCVCMAGLLVSVCV